MADNYRNKLANDLKNQRAKKRIPLIQKSSKELARNMLIEAKKSSEYNKSKTSKFCEILYKPEGSLKVKLNKKIADKLIEAGESIDVAKNIEKFKGLDHKEIADRLIEEGFIISLAKNIEKFEGLDHKEIANKLIEKGNWYVLASNLEKFHGLDEEMIKKLKRDMDMLDLLEQC